MVYLVFRCESEAPLGHRVIKYDVKDLLSWFKDSSQLLSWIRPEWNDEDLWQNSQNFLGGKIYSFITILKEVSKSALPSNKSELHDFISECQLYSKINMHDDCLLEGYNVDLTPQASWYLFDDLYVRKNPSKVSYLLYDNWQLPIKYSSSGKLITLNGIDEISKGSKEGETYFLQIAGDEGCTIDDVKVTKFPKVRLNNFAKNLRTLKLSPDEEVLIFLQDLLTLHPKKTINEIFSLVPERAITKIISLYESDHAPSLLQVSDHFIQIRFMQDFSSGMYCYSYMMFDDLWVEANYDLAYSLARYSSGWSLT